jgi:hypothetical protein
VTEEKQKTPPNVEKQMRFLEDTGPEAHEPHDFVGTISHEAREKLTTSRVSIRKLSAKMGFTRKWTRSPGKVILASSTSGLKMSE